MLRDHRGKGEHRSEARRNPGANPAKRGKRNAKVTGLQRIENPARFSQYELKFHYTRKSTNLVEYFYSSREPALECARQIRRGLSRSDRRIDAQYQQTAQAYLSIFHCLIASKYVWALPAR